MSDEFLNGYPSAVYGRVLGSSGGDPCKWSISEGEQTRTEGGEAGMNRRPTNKAAYLIFVNFGTPPIFRRVKSTPKSE